MNTQTLPRLIPLTDKAKTAIHHDVILISAFPFRLGRESRSSHGDTRKLFERRIGKIPPNNDYYLFDTSERLHISREHCRIEENNRGVYTLFDRGSTCGTTIIHDHRKHHFRFSRHPLEQGDTIILGSPRSPYCFLFQLPEFSRS